MFTKWSDIKHKASPETRERIRQEAKAELEQIESAKLLPVPHVESDTPDEV
jgi:hypothetical protein